MIRKKAKGEPESEEDTEDLDNEDQEEDGPEQKPKSRQHEPDRAGLRIFLVLLIILGLFLPISAYVEVRTASEPNIRFAMTKMAKNLCEMEEANPSASCTTSQLSATEFRDGYTYRNMIDDVVNLVYYGGGTATEYMSQAQKDYVSTWRLKNFHEYSKYLYWTLILALIGIIALVARFYHKGKVLAGSVMTSVNTTLFLLFMWHTINFLFWLGYIPQILSKLAQSAGESPLRALVFGADFGFSISMMHLFVAIGSLLIFIIIVIVRKALRK